MQPENDQLIRRIQQALSDTDFACSSLTALKGGTTSFVFRGDLKQPLSSRAAKSSSDIAVVKYAANYLSCSPDFPLTASRCKFEAYMLAILKDRSTRDSDPGRLAVSTPLLYHFVESENIQVIEYFPGTVTVNEALLSLTDSQAASIGRSIGSWLRAFHDWTSEPEQAKIRNMMANNKEMRALKWKITYEQGTQVLDKFLEVITEEGREMWEEIKSSRVNEEESEEGGDEVGIIHGDFWSGNVLFGDSRTSNTHQLHVIDFELSHVSHRAVDLGQFIGDLLEKGHFHSSVRPNAIALVENFIAGYGGVTEDMAFRIALHAGVHMINWWSRGRKEESEEGKELLRKASEIVARAWKRDKKWFFGNKAFDGLFRE